MKEEDVREDLSRRLFDVVARQLSGTSRIDELRRLSGGASQEVWSFDVATESATIPLILRRSSTSSKSRTSLTQEIIATTETFGFGADVLERLMLNAVRASFLPPDTKDSMEDDFAAEFQRLRSLLPD